MLAPNGEEIGSGPDGETCERCYYVFQRSPRYFKCLLANTINRGSSSDVSKDWPACAQWSPDCGMHKEALAEFNAETGADVDPQDEMTWRVIADWFIERDREGPARACIKQAEYYEPPF